MHQLVAQHIKPVEQDREYPGRVMIAQCGAYRCPRPLEPVSPVGIAGRTIVMLPKGMIDIAVREQHPDFLRDALPDHGVDPMRSAARCVGHERVSTCGSRSSTYHQKKTQEPGV